ncbi:hypothetical protein KAH81_07815 [bacterium]|nr:hypothetical protein [bacterium]
MKKNILCLSVILALLIIGCSDKTKALEESIITSGKIVTLSTITQDGMTGQLKTETVFSGDKSRSITTVTSEMGQQEVIQLWIGKKIYNFAQNQPTGQTMSAPENWKETMSAFGKNPQLLQSADSLGIEDVAGMRCKVYQVDSPQEKAKLWIFDNPDFPVLLRSETLLPFESKTITTEIAFNIEIPEESFAIPQGVEFQDVNWNQMMGQQPPQEQVEK